jgi:CheY-like chemotaxis protein
VWGAARNRSTDRARWMRLARFAQRLRHVGGASEKSERICALVHGGTPALSLHHASSMNTEAPADSKGSSRGLVLVVDDDASSRRALQLLLEDDGYDVVVAANGLEGLMAATSRKPHVVVSDVQMPVMDGPTLLEHLSVRVPEVPVVLMSADPTKRAQATRAYAFIPKPIDFDALERVVMLARGEGADPREEELSSAA